MKEEPLITHGGMGDSSMRSRPQANGQGPIQEPSAPLLDGKGAGQERFPQASENSGAGLQEHEGRGASAPEPPRVHVAPNLLDLATGRAETISEAAQVREQRDINEVVHSMLIIGLVISTFLMVVGIILEILLHQDLPSTQPDVGEILTRLLSLRPSGFMGLGLLVLLATPILRVAGSIIAFAIERDWRFAGITFLVLMVVIASVLLGRG
jgi:uncharacterized membrane protein